MNTTKSWVIKEKQTGTVILETFDRKKVEALNVDRYEAVPIQEHLAGLSLKSQQASNTNPVDLMSQEKVS